MDILAYLYFVKPVLYCVSIPCNVCTQGQFLTYTIEPFYTLVVGIVVLLMVCYKAFILVYTFLHITNISPVNSV